MNNDQIPATITITNALPSGAAFGIAHSPVGANCYIPANIVNVFGNLKCGDLLDAKIIRNPIEANIERTPYMAVHIKPLITPVTPTESDGEPAQEPTLSLEEQARQFTRETLLAGGVWTLNEVFQEFVGPNAVVAYNMAVYTAIDTTLRTMFDNGETSKWAMWNKCGQERASRVWYSCYPERVDVAEFE